ncbi:BgTH12-05356 [Blumeria graminis f. sp. triticale]|uniref:Bgt-2430 n=3 Tax=Blumeria graminis TaxID=34373 RepID=A0A061HM89_BLUGR|nr:hypothetical protein BGT96224_2430 [Blumeria graminis f. sp. tritici 96224]CAD6502766.1 BgTH12-05356 [Blumeria graminis f. sp. triticale]VDB88241.1 Bgt-2430 [Blumeria graminis f. sp. tritici]
MSPTIGGPWRKLWYRWKSLRLPWRKRFLVGLDLHGNTFWEFRNTLFADQDRLRRIVNFSRATHYSEVQISPPWHQWLRHTRVDPPSLAEQSQDIQRQEQMKVLAAAVDAKWAGLAKLQGPSSAESRATLPGLSDGPNGHTVSEIQKSSELIKDHTDQGMSTPKSQSSDVIKKTRQEYPRKPAHAGLNEGWQPKTWSANAETDELMRLDKR